MKTKGITLMVAIFLAGCMENKKEHAQLMLQEPEMRNEIYQAIQNDSTRLRDMIMSIVSIRDNQQNFPMRYRMLSLALNSPTVDSLLVNDSGMRTELLQKMLAETDHNSLFRAEMSRAVQRHASLVEEIKNDLRPR